MNPKTTQQFDAVFAQCREVFENKLKDYGASWRVLRLSSLTDQLFIKAQRIRNIEQGIEQKVDEGIEPEFMGLVNYCLIGLIQIKLGITNEEDRDLQTLTNIYVSEYEKTRDLMLAKNNDYGEAWRNMRVSSFTDLILMKIMRIKQIEDNEGKTIISEGIDSHYRDIINYSLFALIKLSEQK